VKIKIIPQFYKKKAQHCTKTHTEKNRYIIQIYVHEKNSHTLKVGVMDDVTCQLPA